MKSYDPLKAPDSKEWLELDEGERLQLIEQFHKRARVKLPNRKLHSVFHAIVETQLLDGQLPVKNALDRLMSEGLDRHEAIHAIGSILSVTVYGIIKGKAPENPNIEYFRQVGELTAEKWRQSGQQGAAD